MLDVPSGIGYDLFVYPWSQLRISSPGKAAFDRVCPLGAIFLEYGVGLRMNWAASPDVADIAMPKRHSDGARIMRPFVRPD